MRTLGSTLVSLTRQDGIHLIGPRLHFHAFVWTRGQRRIPVYVRLMKVEA